MIQQPLVERAHAKINWTLEVLSKRDDGYHEVRTILQTIDLSDTVTLSAADAISLEFTGRPGSLVDEPIETDLAYRAAKLLRRRTKERRGVRIELEKRIPVAAGFGGGSSDGAATLIALRRFWQLDVPDEEIPALAAQLGSDAPFFLRGGTALATGRGAELTPLPDIPLQRLVVGWPERSGPADKTAHMYAALRPEHYSDGSRTEALAVRIWGGPSIRDEDCFNAFEQVLPEVDPEAAAVFARAAALSIGKPHLCGSGPALFLLLEPDQPAKPGMEALAGIGLRATETHTIASADARALDEALDG